jgi:hypothetical protein
VTRGDGPGLNTSSGCLPLIAMMQASDAGHAHDSGPIGLPPFENTPPRRIFVQGIVNRVFVVVPDVLSNQPPQMGLAQHDQITWSNSSRRQLPTQRSTTPFCQGLR